MSKDWHKYPPVIAFISSFGQPMKNEIVITAPKKVPMTINRLFMSKNKK